MVANPETIKECSGSVGHGKYKVIVEIIEKQKVDYKEVLYIDGLYPIW